MKEKIIFHIDANCAYLSWTAAAMLGKGYPVDIREIPSVISGDPKNRHGIILAKSIPAKPYGIATGQSLFEAQQRCPDLAVFSPDYGLYMLASQAMYDILLEYTPLVERYSIDECFLDYTASQGKFGPPLEAAYEIKDRIKNELGFTVNIGVSINKLLAKMGSELKKPDRVHTLWPDEMEKKMWPLPVSELFMVGRATSNKLNKIHINTIGDLAKADPLHMKALLKSHGLLIWNLANGIDDSSVTLNNDILQKGVGNSTTIPFDVTKREEANMILLALTEQVALRLRKLGYRTSLVSVSIKTGDFVRYSHQIKLQNFINSTDEIYRYASRLLEECWKGEPIRHLGVRVSDFSSAGSCQLSLFDAKDIYKQEKLDKTIDNIRKKYGTKAIMRGVFANGKLSPVQGGTNEGNFIMMGGYEQ